MNYLKLREESLKNAVRDDFFKDFAYTQLGNIDFVIGVNCGDSTDTIDNVEISMRRTRNSEISKSRNIDKEQAATFKSILWAEAKQGKSHDIFESFVQLILTIGREKTFEKYLPPKYIGAFDAEKFAFIEYHSIQEVFYQNDFNWNVAPSNHETKEFMQLHALCEKQLQENSILFKYATDSKELQKFIKLNFKSHSGASEKIAVTKNNFVFVFQKWTESVKDSIAVDWEKAKNSGIIPADFFLADLLSENNESLKENLYVVLKNTKYEFAKSLDEMGIFTVKSVGFLDNQRDHRNFWAIYERPPKEEYWSYIIGRRDLLVPQDIRERKGSFFTPQIWVEKSQQYLAAVLGENWQDEYYIWDCCAGTGNLLNGLTNYRNVWASTLDKADVDVMKDRIANGWNMFENHIFQFDFLNDDFLPIKSPAKLEGVSRSDGGVCQGKLPNELYDIIQDPQKREKLVIYINPPYAEVGDAKQLTNSGKNKTGVSFTKTREKYSDKIGIATKELFAQFLVRIYKELQCGYIGCFSTLKHLQGPNFHLFRNFFKPKLEQLFLVPANTFDNVKGSFPISFQVWNCQINESFCGKNADVYDKNNLFCGQKNVVSYHGLKTLTDWLIATREFGGDIHLGYMSNRENDFQGNNYNYIINNKNQLPNPRGTDLTDRNLIYGCVFLAVKQVCNVTWLNNRDQFLYPNDGWKEDFEFQSDCLVFTLFHGQNRISVTSTSLSDRLVSGVEPNHWIPFTEQEVGCKNAFKSDFMSNFIRDFLAGKIDVSAAPQHDGIFGLLNEEKSSPKLGEVSRSDDGVCQKNNTRPSQQADSPSNLEGHSKLRQFSPEAQAVYDAGLELWRYYHAQKNANPDVSFYDIRKYFQGETNGRMNATSEDEKYTALIQDLRGKMKVLAAKIAVKVYEYGFLK